MKKYMITLTIEEREQLQALIAAGKAAAQTGPRASSSRPTPPQVVRLRRPADR